MWADTRGSEAPPATSALERLVRRDRAAAVVALLSLTAIAWWYLVRMAPNVGGSAAAASMEGMEGMAMAYGRQWSVSDLSALFLMWATMMVAMMLPSAAPMILLVASVNRRRRERASPAAPTAVFAAGYIIVWTAFSAVAALAQWGLHRAALLSPAMASASPLLGGAILMAAGAYQWLPVKSVCLSRCRSPLGFLGSEWREGSTGAVMMGLRHGLFCVGCCWALMTLLFVAGVMNLVWVATIAGLVLLEKLAPAGARVGRLAGLVLIVWGAATLSSAF